MIDFLEQNQLFIVLILVLLIWFGILIYLRTIENKIVKLEQVLKKQKGNN